MPPAPPLEKVDRHGKRRGYVSRKAWTGLLLAALIGAVPLGWMCRRPLFQHNLAVLADGQLVRSAQPTGQLPRWIRDHGLRSVLNLRGGTQQDWWYVAEIEACQAGGASFYDLFLSAIRRPTRRELLILIEFLDRCEYPLLVHCKWGSDRTAMAVALYRMLKEGASPEEAEKAFSIEFGHIPFDGPEHLHEPFREYAQWLKSEGHAHTPARFREWVRNDYKSADDAANLPRLLPGPRMRQIEHLLGQGATRIGPQL